MLFSDGTVGADLIRERTALFGTASPSYVLLASLDAAMVEMRENGRDMWAKAVAFTHVLRQRDERVVRADDPAKLVVVTGDGYGDAARLESEFGVVCEMADANRIVFMLSPHNTEDDLSRLERALEKIPKRDVIVQAEPKYIPRGILTPREACFAPRERVLLRDAAGRTAACVFGKSPPGAPVFAPGEEIDKKSLDILFGMCYTGEESLWVVR